MKKDTHTKEYANTHKHPSVAHSVLDQIQDITPHSKAHFMFQNVLFWVLFASSVLIGSAAVAATFFTAMNVGWEFYEATHDTALTFLFAALPYVWLLIILGMVFLGYFNVRHTKKGYRYSLFAVVGVSVIGSVLGGAMLYSAGMGRMIDEKIGQYLPLHSPALMKQQEFWNTPERGFFAGAVEAIDTNTMSVTLKDFDGMSVVLSTKELRDRDLQVLERETHVRVIGIHYDTDGVVYACYVFPWIAVERPQQFKEMQDQRKAFLARMEEAKKERERFETPERSDALLRSSKCLDVRPDRQSIRDGVPQRVLGSPAHGGL